MNLDVLTIILLVGLVVVAAFVNGTIGFGFALLAVNVLALLFGAKSGVIVMSLLAPIISGIQLWHHRARRGLLGRLRPMLAGALIGTTIGTQLLVFLPATAISLALGLFTVWYVLDAIRHERPPMADARQRWMGPVAGIVGGTSNGAIGASGPVFGTYLNAIGLRGPDFAFAISAAFFTMALYRIGLLGALGQYTATLAGLGLALAVPMILGQQVGLWFKGRVPERLLYRGVLAVLFVAGLNLLWRSASAFAGVG